MRAASSLGLTPGVVVANPIDRGRRDGPGPPRRTLAPGLTALAEAGVTGKDVTPFLLGTSTSRPQGASLAANIALVLANARLAARSRWPELSGG